MSRRIVAFLSALAAAAALALPAHAAPTAADYDITLHVPCLGCGVISVSGSGECLVQCQIFGVTCAPLLITCPYPSVAGTMSTDLITCPITGTVDGVLQYWSTVNPPVQMLVTWVGALAVVTITDGNSTAVGIGAVVLPPRTACGGPADVRFVGQLVGS